jgi:hypothetical protein
MSQTKRAEVAGISLPNIDLPIVTDISVPVSLSSLMPFGIVTNRVLDPGEKKTLAAGDTDSHYSAISR